MQELEAVRKLLIETREGLDQPSTSALLARVERIRVILEAIETRGSERDTEATVILDAVAADTQLSSPVPILVRVTAPARVSHVG